MTEMTEARAQLEDARREKAELDELIAGLEQQVREGDETEAQRALAERYGLQRLAQLRAEAAEIRVRKAEAAALEERRREAEAAAAADLEILSVDRIADALTAAVDALAELQRLGDARQAAIERHAKTFVELGMSDRIVHRDGGWVVFTAGGSKYDTSQDDCRGKRLVALAGEELVRRGLAKRYQEQGCNPPAPLPHQVTRSIARREAEGKAA